MSQQFKQAKELYKNGKYQECYEIAKEILRNSLDYGILILKGASCSRLEYHEEAIESYLSALEIDPENTQAWFGLYSEVKRSPDKNANILLKACSVLINKSSRSDSPEKYLDYSKTFIETAVRFQLPLPAGYDKFDDLCELVLESEPGNVYALEAFFRLQIEFFMFYGFPELIDQSLFIESKFAKLFKQSGPQYISPSSVYVKRLERFGESLKTIQESKNLSKTSNITLCLGHLLYKLYVYFIPNFASPTDNNEYNVTTSGDQTNEHIDLWDFIQNEINKLDYDGIIGLNNWIEQNIIDLHAGFLYALSVFKRSQFNECNLIINQLISYIDKNCRQYNTESTDFTGSVDKLSKSSTSNIPSQRLMCTPLRLNITKFSENVPTTCDIYAFVKYWLSTLLIANTCNSEVATNDIDEEIGTLLRQTENADYIPYGWKDVFLTLSMEYYLLVNNIKASFHILEKWKSLYGCQKESKIDNAHLSPRFQVCLVLLKLVFNLKPAELKIMEEITPLSAKEDLLNLLKKSDAISSSRFQYLLGYVMKICVQSFKDCSSTMGLEQQLEKFSLGIQFDMRYYANYLQIGHIYREKENSKESLTAYTEAYRLMPSLPTCVYYYAVGLCRQEEWEKALDVYSSIDKSEFTKDMWLNYGLIGLRLGRIYECLPALQRVVLLKNEALYWEILGEAYLLRGSHETAIRSFNRALGLEPNRPFALILCGRAYRHMNEISASLSCFDKALSEVVGCYMTDPLYRKFYVLILKELIEIHMMKCRSSMYQGFTGQAINDLQHVLHLLDKLLDYFVGSKVVPFWIFRYIGDVLSLLSVVDDPNLLIVIPSRIISLMNNAEEICVDSKLTDDTIKLNIVNCLQLANIYLACAIQIRLSSVRHPAASLQLHAPNDVVASGSDSENHPSKLLIISSLLVSFGVHQLNQGYYIQRNMDSNNKQSPILSSLSNSSTHQIKYNGLSPDELFCLSESILKQALQLLDNVSNIYEEFLNELLKDKSLLGPGVTTPDDEVDERDTRDRLALIRRIRSRAWSALAGVYSTSEENLNSEITYCLCQALLFNPDNTTVMINLAMHQMKQGQTELAVNLVAQAKAIDPDNFRVWLFSAQLTALMSGSPSVGPGLLVNTEVLGHLIQAAFTGSNYRVASQLTLHLMPIIIKYSHCNFLSDPSLPSSTSYLSKQVNTSELIQAFDKRAHLRLSINVAIECLNRAIAFQPDNIRLWHNRGILLQLTGYSVPAKYCLKKAVALLNRQKSLYHQGTSNELAFYSLVLSQYFLITYICGQPDWQTADQLLTLTKNPNSTFCHSLPEACAKAIIYLIHPMRAVQRDLSMKCMTEEIDRLICEGSCVAKSAIEFQPNGGACLLNIIKLIDSSYFGPVKDLHQLESCLIHLKSVTSSSVSFPLAYNLSQIGVRLGSDVNWLIQSNLSKLIYEISSSKHMEYEELSSLPDLYNNRLRDNYLPLGGQLTDIELNNWMIDNAYLSLCSSRPTSGLAYISRYLIHWPNKPLRWIYLFAWLLNENPIDQSTNLSTIKLKSNMSIHDKLTIYTNVIIKCLSVINELRTECLMNSLFASALVNFGSWLLTVCKNKRIPIQLEQYDRLLWNLRRAAVLFPNTPNILSTLMSVSAATCV
uniref:TPR_REGION domain-containing protein n=1 Tax=Trichobilharzia regenti TaxID=157069 RepID=A0AA85KFY1_TRIRE|nr:unnamed protein product [Trichobilharzia regenti]